MKIQRALATLSLSLLCAAGAQAAGGDTITLLNVSYDPTREFYTEYNRMFAEHWLKEHAQTVEIEQSHGGSSKQARAVIDGLGADVVTLALAYDIDAIAKNGKLLPVEWQTRLPCNSAPYTSTVVFVVRKGNPKGVHDWGDLLKPGIEVITPNPKTSGGARWNYLAAWGYALKSAVGRLPKRGETTLAAELAAAEPKAREFVTELYKRVPVLDSGARGSTTTFVQREIGDVLLAWENEAFLAVKELGPDKLEIVVPSISVLAEPAVALVDKNVDKKRKREVAQGYLEYLYSPPAQALAAKHFFRPCKPEGVAAEDLARFPKIELFTIDDVFGGWQATQKQHFEDGAVFDQIYQPGK